MSFVFISCGGIPSDEAKQFGNPSIELLKTRTPGQSVTFDQLRIGLIQPDCVSCHAEFEDESTLHRWITPGDPSSSLIYQAVATGRMPKARAKLEGWKIALLKDFILQMNPPEEPIPELTSTYTALKYHLFEKSCNGCHNPDTVEETSFDFTTYANVRASLFDIEDAAINDSRMPKDPMPKVTEAVKAAFREWMKKGALND